jgi:hypothetical protein
LILLRGLLEFIGHNFFYYVVSILASYDTTDSVDPSCH